MNTASSGRPWHLWLVGLVSLAWNAFGGYDYYMTQTGNRAYLEPMTEPYGVRVEDALAYFDGFPLWVELAWAVGVWGSVAGAVLLLVRRGFAFYAFVLSLIGQLAALAWQLPNGLPGATDTPVAYAMTGVITAFLLFQIWYSRRMALRGVLR